MPISSTHSIGAVILFVILSAAQCSGAVNPPFFAAAKLSTKTPYRVYSSNIPTAQTVPDGCALIHSNLLARHGTRFPTTGGMKDMKRLEQTLARNVDKYKNTSRLSWAVGWKSPYNLAEQGSLVAEGMDEHYGLGKRYYSQYSSLLGGKGYNASISSWQNTEVERAAVSAQSFAFGAFQGINSGIGNSGFTPIYSYNLPKSKDPELRPFDACEKYSKWESTFANVEHQAWINEQFPSIAHNLSQLFNFVIDNGLAEIMYDACTYDFSVFDNENHWCTIFSPAAFEIFEYASDLDDYYTRSYGAIPIAYQISSVLLQDFVAQIDAVISSRTSPSTSSKLPTSAKLRFAHAETVIPFLSMLGLFKDTQPLRADSPPYVITNRQFKTSWISPYASNIHMLAYDCSTSSDSKERFRIKLMLNERVLPLSQCGASLEDPYCGLEEFKRQYHAQLSFKFDESCSTDNKFVSISPAIIVWAGIPTALLIFVSLGMILCFRESILSKK